MASTVGENDVRSHGPVPKSPMGQMAYPSERNRIFLLDQFGHSVYLEVRQRRGTLVVVRPAHFHGHTLHCPRAKRQHDCTRV
jgi:hypothetical protein